MCTYINTRKAYLYMRIANIHYVQLPRKYEIQTEMDSKNQISAAGCGTDKS